MEKILLSSSSPRRKEILASLRIPFEVAHPEIDEAVFDSEIPSRRVILLAAKKAEAGLAPRSGPSPGRGARLCLGADTLVAFNTPAGWKTLGKPASREEAVEMLQFSQGKTQLVFSGIHLLDMDSGQTAEAVSCSEVSFMPMSREWIEWYADTGEWEGAAGAYRVQGRGSMFLSDMRGSWSGVMGLPIHELFDILKKLRYEF